MSVSCIKWKSDTLGIQIITLFDSDFHLLCFKTDSYEYWSMASFTLKFYFWKFADNIFLVYDLNHHKQILHI